MVLWFLVVNSWGDGFDQSPLDQHSVGTGKMLLDCSGTVRRAQDNDVLRASSLLSVLRGPFRAHQQWGCKAGGKASIWHFHGHYSLSMSKRGPIGNARLF